MPTRRRASMPALLDCRRHLLAGGAGKVAQMWGSVLGLGILAALNPVRLGLALLMISRPRPGPSLFAYWVGGLTVCVPELLIPLMVLNFTSMFGSSGRRSASRGTGSALGHIQIGLGVLGLTIAAVVAVRLLRRRGKHAVALGETASAPVAAMPIPRLLARGPDPEAGGGSAFRRVLSRVRSAWDNGSSWVAWVIGLVSVPVDGVLFIVAIIAASGASITAQAGAAIAFITLMYAVVEVILVGYLVKPVTTHALLQVLHDWVRAYHLQILMVMFAVVGVSQLAQGLSSG